jgi:hypothetical protein
MIRGLAPSHTPSAPSVPADAISGLRSDEREGRPRTRTSHLIIRELRSVREQLDRHLASGDLALAAECSFDLEQLRIEMAALKLRGS